MQDITPLLSSGVKSIESYGDGGFKISGEKISGNVFVFQDQFYELTNKRIHKKHTAHNSQQSKAI